MSSLTRLVISIALVLLAFQHDFAKAEGCHGAAHPIHNEYFHISCSKSLQLTITVQCKKLYKWDLFPRNNITLKTVKLVIQDCNIPQSLTLCNFTKSLLKIGKVEAVEFKNLQSKPIPEFFDGYDVILKEVIFKDQKFLELPGDLFRGVDVEIFEVDNVGLTNIPTNFFNNSLNPTNMEELHIHGNSLTKLNRSDFVGLDKLTRLWLFNNEIEEIEEHTFDNFTSLELLELSDNKLKTLPAHIFKRLLNLHKIVLSENDFNYLPADLLRNNSKLTKLRLNYNRGELASIPNGFFRNLRNLKTVQLIGNNFTSLPVDAFLGSSSLENLDLTGNRLVTLPLGIFESTSKFKYFNITYNKLEMLHDGIFEDADLRELKLDYNCLTNITSNLLLGLEDLEIFSASHNNIYYISKDFSVQMKKLKKVNFSHNRIALEPSEFNSSLSFDFALLEDIDLSYNQIVQIPDDLMLKHYLKSVNFEGNNITELTINEYLLFSFNSNSSINVKNNKIHTVHLDDEYLKEWSMNNKTNWINPKIILDHNPLNCECNMIELARYFQNKRNNSLKLILDIEADELTCNDPPKYKNVKIKNIEPTELSCLKKSVDANDACNKTCTCWNYPGKPQLLVDCSNRNLTKVPQYVVNSNNWSIALNMSGNNLRKTPELTQSYLLNITSLDLSNNNISLVSTKVFSNSLRILKLHNNRITRLDESVITTLTTNRVLNQLTLHNNKWECTCESRKLLKFIDKKSNTTFFGNHLQDIICEHSGRPLYRLSWHDLCNTTDKMVRLVVIISLIIAFFGVLMGVLVALYYKYEIEIKIWLYAKQWCMWLITEDEVDKNKKYDAFVSFSYKDEEFIKKEIVPRLEGGSKPFKLCLHYRDWLAGEWIPNQIARSVEESRRTIIVLSPNFVESMWATEEFRAAYIQARDEKRVRLIVILYEDIGNLDDLDLGDEFKSYLKMNTYIKWGDPLFWDRLIYAMPHRCEPKTRTSTNRRAQLIEMHLAETNYNRGSSKPETKTTPKTNGSSNDSTKLLDPSNDDEKVCP